MSEYQYYEFAAIDGPISDEGLRYARGCSSRANVSRVRWQNTYSFGDFHGSVDTLLKYYDAHFYIANWGTVRLGLAFPKGTIAREAIQPYLRGGEQYEDTLTVKEIGNRCIVWWEHNEEEGGSWTEGEGLIDTLIGVREELLRGDYRALFLGWLADFDPEEWQDPGDGAVLVPPVPAGLDRLSPALVALTKHFPVDRDALAVAAGRSQALASDRIPLAAVLEGLSVPEMRALLARVAEGGGVGVMTELNRLTYPRVDTPAGQAMRCIDFAAQAIAAGRRTPKPRRQRGNASSGSVSSISPQSCSAQKRFGQGSTRSWIRKSPQPTTKWPPNWRNCAMPLRRPETPAASRKRWLDFGAGTPIARRCSAGSRNCD